MKQIIFKNYYSVFTKTATGKLEHKSDLYSLEEAENYVSIYVESQEEISPTCGQHAYLSTFILPTIKPVEA